MSTAWTRATKILATTALAAASALAIGCGPAPGYETQEPRVPVGYTAIDGPEPATSEELAARAQAAQQTQQQDPADPQQVAAQGNGNGDIALGADNTQYTDTDPSALTEFRPALEGHGQWVDDPTYGTVWVPASSEVGTDFVPYTTGGHWTYSDDTNYVWVSDYSWGWAPFHYGRWAHVGPRGWVWIPGRTYAGAWVSWRTGAGYDYVGWAPLGPDWYWRDGYAYGWGWGWSPYYSYCNRGYLYDGRLGGHIVRGPDYDNHTRPYVASAPPAGGGRTAATPAVGRTPASPSVGGARTAASATVGPRPAELGIRGDAVVAPPKDNAGLARAAALASPSTAVAHGAAPPASANRRRDPSLVATSASGHPGVEGRVSSAPSSRFDAAARAPQVQGVAPASRPTSSFAGRPSTTSAPAYRSAPTYSSGPIHSAPSYSPSSGSSSFSHAAGPTVAHGTVAAPVVHPSAPSAPHTTVRAPSRGKR